jgi:hypothetical protein
MRRVLLVLVVACALAPAAGAAVIHLGGGSTVTVSSGGRVVQRDAKGRLVAESFCGSLANYRRWSSFLAGFQAAVRAHDRAGVASRVAFPLSWNHGRSTTIRTRAQLLRLYPAIFRGSVVRAIRSSDARALFCRNGDAFMLGSGVVWGIALRGRIGVFAINSV